MGFIPIIVTMSGAIMLFFMVVNYHLKAKKSQIIQLKGDVISKIDQLGNPSGQTPGIVFEAEQTFEEKYIGAKKSIHESHSRFFKNEVKAPYLKAKLLTVQYNTLVKTKPYSFVAKILGHHPL